MFKVKFFIMMKTDGNPTKCGKFTEKSMTETRYLVGTFSE